MLLPGFPEDAKARGKGIRSQGRWAGWCSDHSLSFVLVDAGAPRSPASRPGPTVTVVTGTHSTHGPLLPRATGVLSGAAVGTPFLSPHGLHQTHPAGGRPRVHGPSTVSPFYAQTVPNTETRWPRRPAIFSEAHAKQGVVRAWRPG